ncbi:MAG TPA: 4-hydroxy-tetrahydrodipicolinate synthase [Humisphaera sp.]|nr:4-hydroxy-tetrahydrodipicolinate synthase [Humisphaera sp.]
MFHGAYTAMVSPFSGGKLDEARLREQVEYQIKHGIDGLVPVGTTGESPTLDFKEHARVLELTVQLAKGRVPVIAGVGANSTSEAMELHHIAKRVGANACLSVNPYYNKPSQEGLYRHFMALADAVDLPIVLYNIPGRTGITMSAPTVARLYKESGKRIAAIKEATGSMDMASEIMALCDITVLSGDDSLTVPLMALGAKGVISVVSNLLPAETHALAAAALKGDFATARSIHHRLFPLIRSLFLDGNPAGIKHAMKIAGRDTGELRLPLWEASDATKKTIEDLIGALAADAR